jgi:regulatory protein
VYPYALRLLTRRNYFEEELRRKLSEKFPDESPAETIQRLKEDRYLDDERTLRGFIRWQVDSGHGPYYIRDKLYQKGVNVSIQQICAIIVEEELDLDEKVRELAQKYVKSKRKQATTTLLASCMRYIQSRGFDMSASLKIIKEVTKDESDFFEGC